MLPVLLPVFPPVFVPVLPLVFPPGVFPVFGSLGVSGGLHVLQVSFGPVPVAKYSVYFSQFVPAIFPVFLQIVFFFVVFNFI